MSRTRLCIDYDDGEITRRARLPKVTVTRR